MGLIYLYHLRKQSKQQALFLLRGNWGKSILVILIYAVLYLGIEKLEGVYRDTFGQPLLTSNGAINDSPASVIVTVVFTAVSFLLFSPVILGIAEWFWNLTGSKRSGFGEVFSWFGSFKLYLKSVLLRLNIFFRSILWYLLIFCLPIAMFAAGLVIMAGQTIDAGSEKNAVFILLGAGLVLMGLVLMLGAAFLYLFVTTKYMAAKYILVDDRDITPNAAVKRSIDITRGYRWELTKFQLSFIGWFALCILLIPALYVGPYYLASLAVMVKNICASKQGQEQSQNQAR